MPHDQNRVKTSTASLFAVAWAALAVAGCTPAEPTKKAHAETPAVTEAPSAAAVAASTVAEAPGQPDATAAKAATAVAAPTPTATATAGGSGQRPAPPSAAAAVAPAPAAPAVVRASTGLPPGAGRDLTQRVCTACHAIGMVTAKGRSSQDWAEIIGRMQGLGLEASDNDLYTIHDYLSRELPPRRGN